MITNIPWRIFHWEISTLQQRAKNRAPLDQSFSIRYAASHEKEIATEVALLALKMNTEWNDSTILAREAILQAKKRSFSGAPSPACFVVDHGGRIIATSMLDTREEAPSHLLSGPWVLTEYRNRGLGSALLEASLEHLATAGLQQITALTRGNTTSSRFVYPKFGGVSAPCASPELLLN